MVRNRSPIFAALLWWSATLVATTALPAGAGEASLRERSVHLAYRLDRELGPIDAAQRHALVARLLLARRDGELTAGDAMDAVWLDWEAKLELLERETAIGAFGSWYEPTLPDAADGLIQTVRADQAQLTWSDPLWRDERAAAALRVVTAPGNRDLAKLFQPGVLAWARHHAPELWFRLLAWLEEAPEVFPLVEPLVAPWLARPLGADLATWQALDDAAAAEIGELLAELDGDPLAPLRDAVALLTDAGLAADRASGVMRIDEPYRRFAAQRLEPLDYGLLSLAWAAREIDAGAYGAFVSTLLAVTGQLVREPAPVVSQGLLPALQELDPVLLPWFQLVDPRLTNVYQRTRQLLREPPSGPEERRQVLRELGLLQATASLTSRSLESYLEQPVRSQLDDELTVCFGLTRDVLEGPPEPLAPGQFDACVTAFSDWAIDSAGRPELAGQQFGPFEPENLLREGRLSPWQRINYWLGYLDRLEGSSCELAGEALVNPLEWTLAARALTWFVDRWPQYADAATVARVETVFDLGRRTVGELEAARSCATAGAPLLGAFGAYEEALGLLQDSLSVALDDFREARLKPGADIDLGRVEIAPTRYRPQRLEVGPCDAEPSCETADRLEASNALYSRFPAEYLLADQIDLGDVEICYRDVQWIDRRSELPPVRIEAMARYFGRLSFVLEGRYSDLRDPVFAMRLEGATEYEYLYGANAQEVLDDPCPRHLLNTQVHAELPERMIQLVPRRLTYMTADRMHPGRVFGSHWAAGEEWRDRFVTGEGVEVLAEQDGEPIREQVLERLAELSQERTRTIYRVLLAGEGSLLDGESDPLVTAMQQVEAQKSALVAIAKLLAPASLEGDPGVRASFHGEFGLFDRAGALRAQQAGVSVADLGALAEQRLADGRREWERLRGESDGALEVDRAIVRTLLDLRGLLDRVGNRRLTVARVDGDDGQIQ
ncbi:MAG: hypothetical protein AAGE01_14090 [Pseudomonadota bacterium]